MPGRAEAAGVRAGDEVLGVGGEVFEEKPGLRDVVARIRSHGDDVVLLLKRGRRPRSASTGGPAGLTKMARVPGAGTERARRLQDASRPTGVPGREPNVRTARGAGAFQTDRSGVGGNVCTARGAGAFQTDRSGLDRAGSSYENSASSTRRRPRRSPR